AEANFYQRTSCSVIGIDCADVTTTNPGPNTVLPETGEIIMIGTTEGESEFMKLFG
ncbi:MAG: K+/H+ antiporter YhaU regulatory subunit KhtT, partial [Halioglobus sp.]